MAAAKNGLEARIAEMFDEVREATVDYVGLPSDIQREPVWQRLHQVGCEVEWVAADALEHRKADGWKPVVDRRGQSRTIIYMDRLRSQVLLFKAPDRPADAGEKEAVE